MSRKRKLVTKNKLEEGVFLLLKRLKLDYAYEDTKIPYVKLSTYMPDFRITLPNGKIIFVETKGYFRPADRSKMLAVKKCNPELDIRIVFQVDKKISKNSKTTYTEWATKNGFPSAIGTPPKEWFQ